MSPLPFAFQSYTVYNTTTPTILFELAAFNILFTAYMLQMAPVVA